MAATTKWLVTFSTPKSGAMMLKETVEATQWLYAKAMMESKYEGVKILSYTTVR